MFVPMLSGFCVVVLLMVFIVLGINVVWILGIVRFVVSVRGLSFVLMVTMLLSYVLSLLVCLMRRSDYGA